MNSAATSSTLKLGLAASPPASGEIPLVDMIAMACTTAFSPSCPRAENRKASTAVNVP
jgi:hypothetical protein